MEKYENLDYVIPYAIIIIVFVSLLILVFTSIHMKSQKKIFDFHLKQSKTQIEHQKELLQKIVQTQEEERKRIGRIIHDDIGNRIQILSICVQQIDMKKNRSSEILLQQLPLLSEATRSLAHDMYPVEIEYIGLKGMLENIQLHTSEVLYVEVIFKEYVKYRNSKFDIQLYRIIQEFMNNVLKYANASHVNIHIRQNEKYTTLVISDNGVGFEIENVVKGMGMNNIEYRVKILYGKFKWKSKKNKGTTLIIKFTNDYE